MQVIYYNIKTINKLDQLKVEKAEAKRKRITIEFAKVIYCSSTKEARGILI